MWDSSLTHTHHTINQIGVSHKQKRERKKKDNKKSPKTVQYTRIDWNETMHAWECMNMWHAIEKASWAQSNLNLPAHNQFNIYNTHLNAWKLSYNAYEMQCMRFLRSNLQKLIPKILKNLFDFENPQNFQKSQKLRLKIMKCMNMRD